MEDMRLNAGVLDWIAASFNGRYSCFWDNLIYCRDLSGMQLQPKLFNGCNQVY